MGSGFVHEELTLLVVWCCWNFFAKAVSTLFMARYFCWSLALHDRLEILQVNLSQQKRFNWKIFPWVDLDPGRIKQNNSGQAGGFFIHVVVSNNGQRAFDIGTTRRDEPSSKSPKCTLSTMHHSPFKLLFYQLFRIKMLKIQPCYFNICRSINDDISIFIFIFHNLILFDLIPSPVV